MAPFFCFKNGFFLPFEGLTTYGMHTKMIKALSFSLSINTDNG